MKIGRGRFDDEDIDGYPILQKYKYLGMDLDKDLCAKTHLRYINMKIGFITYKLSALRKMANIKLNINLFKTFIAPLYKLAGAVYRISDKNTKNFV
jgi:hypothetical protein